MAAATAWEEYLANFSPDIASLRRRLEDLDEDLFSLDDINVRVTDIGHAAATSRKCDCDDALWAVINDPPPERTRIRIISVYSERTIAPLQISSEHMCGIFEKYNVHPDFLRVLFSFGEQPHLAEASSGNLAIHYPDPQQNQISYQINYVEENLRKGQDPWSFRHTGIYHHHTSDFDLYILLHPNQHSVTEAQLFKILGIELPTASHQPQLSNFCREPYRLHMMLLSSFFDNWRWYFRDLGDHFTHENNRAMVIKPENTDVQSSFQSVQSLRNMNDFALFAKACSTGSLKVVEGLKSSVITPFRDAGDLDVQMTMLREFVESSSALESRIRNAIDLVGYTLTLHHTLETAKVDKELRDELRDMTEIVKDLTQDPLDESVAVRIIIFILAFYLPGSLVASLFGMNFFVFDTESSRIVVGNDIWIFIATWLPLTAITAAIYLLTLRLHKRSKGKSRPGPWPWPWTRGQRQKPSTEKT